MSQLATTIPAATILQLSWGVWAVLASRKGTSAVSERPGPLKVADVSAEGLLLDDGDRHELAGWYRITEISVGTATGPHGAPIFVMVFGLACGRLVVCTERNEVWHVLIAALGEHLPGIVPFGGWAPILVDLLSEALVIYTGKPMGTA